MARTVRGLEWIAYNEIESAGFSVETASLERTLFVPLGQQQPTAVTGWQSVDDAFFLLLQGSDFGRHRMDFKNAAFGWERFNWSAALTTARGRLKCAPIRRFTVSASFNGKRNFNRFELEDALGEAIHQNSSLEYVPHRDCAQQGASPSLRLHLDGKSCSIGLRLSKFPLHRREWKICTSAGTLHPPVAAAMTQFLAQNRTYRVVDPFCGCGTILVELGRRSTSRHQLHGYDICKESIQFAGANATAAGVKLRLAVADAAAIPLQNGCADALVTNPPWGQQVVAHDPDALLSQFLSEADRLLTVNGCLIVLHDWGNTLAENATRKGFEILHDQNLRTSGRIARLTISHRKGGNQESSVLDLDRLQRARSNMLSTSGADFIL